MPATPLKRPLQWSIEDYHQIVNTGILAQRRVEAGEILEMAPESADHTYSWGSLVTRLSQMLGDRALVRPPAPITLSQSEPEPDIAIVTGTWERYIDRHPSADDIFWLIEISRPTLAFDRTVKAPLYAAEGIAEYWIINLKERQLERDRQPSPTHYRDRQVLNGGAIAPLAFPDCILEVRSLFP
ncbi:Uma2 family endonuclease [Arthrospira sp. PCC 8006]|uniref:Uma2 family endonuclease n=1 Tax=Arthrospira sp. PCC 8006 TaxID=1982224 RepID=UPI00396DF391